MLPTRLFFAPPPYCLSPNTPPLYIPPWWKGAASSHAPHGPMELLFAAFLLGDGHHVTRLNIFPIGQSEISISQVFRHQSYDSIHFLLIPRPIRWHIYILVITHSFCIYSEYNIYVSM